MSASTQPRALLLARDDKFHPGIEDSLAAQRVVPWLEEIGIDVTQARDRSVISAEGLRGFDLFLPWLMPQWESDLPAAAMKAQAQEVETFVRSGGGLFAFHGATVVPEAEPYRAYVDVLGARFRSHPKYQEFLVRVLAPEHPITRGLHDFRTSDELYIHEAVAPDAEILSVAEWEGEQHPMAYTRRVGRGAVVYLALGHDSASWDHPAFRQLVVNGVRWLLEVTGAADGARIA